MVKTIMRISLFYLACCVSFVFAQDSESVSMAERATEEYYKSIFQVRIINQESQSQSSLGTGFFIGDGQYFATNYHVVSSVVLGPEEYVAVIDYEGEELNLDLLAVDVINDLALLRAPVKLDPLLLSTEVPTLGARLFSIGNPLDIGMTLVEGNYNGLVENRFFDRIHFSGAINSGMSGGPTINAIGEVVGINVASAGNQVGFLVPVGALSILLNSVNPQSSSLDSREYFQRQIAGQIEQATHSMIDAMLAQEWTSEKLGEAQVVAKVHEAVDCWGDSNESKETGLRIVQKGCNTRDGFYISPELQTGYIEYEFAFHEADSWSEAAFYRHASQAFSTAYPGNVAGLKDVDNYQCIDDIIEISGKLRKKIAYCTRPYIRYEGLFDTFYMAVTVDRPRQVLMEHYTLSGINQRDAQRFLARFIEQVSWQ
jgi:serine protease Do